VSVLQSPAEARDGVAAFLQRVESRLTQAVGYAPGPAADAAAGTLAAGGKRLRPSLIHLSALGRRGDSDGVASAAAAVELVHMATLVHDDMIDAAPLRRGRPTVWAAHGAPLARACGDYLFARAFGELAALGDPWAIRALAGASLDLAHGEVMQAAQSRRPETPVECYLERCRLKTASLFACACALGARLSGMAPDEVEALRRYGEALGTAFQLADDLLDCTGDPASTGKALGTDLLDGTVTMPLLVAARRDAEVADAIRDRERARADVLGLLARVEASGAIDETRAAAEAEADRAVAALNGVGSRRATSHLRAIVHQAVNRDR